MEEPSLEVVLKALDSLFRKEDTQEKEHASLWLTQLQSSVHAWKIADQLLLLQRDMETSYFAAQTMQSKVRFHFPELPAETHVSLRDSLMNHLQNLRDAPAPITRQLALALADLALQMMSWTSVVSDLISCFSGDMSTVPALLDVLIVLPEEINNRSLHLGHSRRKELREMLGRDCLVVLQLLVACLSSCSNSFEILTRVYACLGSWVQLGNFPCEDLAQSPLISAPFQTLHLLEVPTKLYEAACDCICSALYTCEDAPDYYPMAVALQAQVKNLLPVYQAAVQAEDSNRAFCLCRIFTEMAESFLYHLVNRPNSDLGDLSILDMVLECVGNHDYEVAEITFNVWYRLSEELTKINDSQLSDVFKPYVHRLVSHLCVHCRLDEDASPSSVPDKNDDFSEFRDQVVELLRDVAFLVGSLPLFSELYKTICKPGTPWNVTEACLFVMQALAGFIPLDESEVLPIAVPVLLSISPDTHFAIRSITLKLVAQLSEWINKHPDMLDQVLKFVLDGLHIPSVASDAAKAVQNVCHKCKERMAPHFEGLLQIIQAADALSISNEAVIGLLKGATDVLTMMPADLITSGVRTLCSFQIQPLSQLVTEGSIGVSGTHSDPCVWVDRLTAVFRSCVLKIEPGQTHPCAPILEELWPVVSTLCHKYKHDQRIVERICRCLRFMLRSTSSSAAAIISPLATMCVDIYRVHHHSCFLYLGSIVVDEFGADVLYQQGLIGMLQAFAEVSLPLLAGPTGLVNHPDTIDDLFRLSARFLQRCPTAFLTSSVSPTLIQCALAACSLNHRDAFTSVMKFFRDLIHLPLQPDQLAYNERQGMVKVVHDFLSQNGQLLVDGLVTGFISLPTFMTAESSEVLWALLQFNREIIKGFLKSALDKVPVSASVQVTDDQKAYFIDSVSTCEKLDDIYPLVKDLARLYR